MNKIKLVLCDDFKDLTDSYKERLELEPDLEVSAVYYSGADCVAGIGDVEADILLLDIQMETKTIGIDIIPRIKQLQPAMKIIMLSSYNMDEYIFNAFTNGATNYILKDESSDVMLQTIRDVYKDKLVISNNVAKQILNKAAQLQNQQQSLLYFFNKLHQLTKTEFEVLSALYNGQNYSQIARDRFVEENTIRKIASNILHKFDSKNMRDLLNSMAQTQVFEFFR